MTEQEIKELEYLRHAIRNGTTKLMGLLKEAENIVTAMGVAVRSFRESNGYDKPNGKTDQE